MCGVQIDMIAIAARKLFIGFGLAGLLVPAAQAQTWAPPLRGPAEGEIQVLHVKGSVYMLAGSGGNIAVQVGDQGTLLVDTGSSVLTGEVLAAIGTITPEPIRYIVNTSHAVDYTGGNAAIAAAGRQAVNFRGAGSSSVQGQFGADRASVISFYTVFHRMAAPPGGMEPREEAAWPNNTFSIPLKRLNFNDEPVMIMHRPSTTDGNVVVLFRKSDVVAAGALLNLETFPVIDVDAGGSIQAVVDGLNGLIDLAVPSGRSEGGTLIVPGRGRIADFAETAQQRDMMTVIRDRVQDMIDKGMTLAEVIEAGPTRGYDARYGRDTGPWTTEMFVEAVYRSLNE